MSNFLPPQSTFFTYQDHNHHHFDHKLAGVDQPVMMLRSMSSYSGRERCEEVNAVAGDTSEDEGSQLGEKKRRLNLEQVKALEKSFELGNKLEPERKRQLARALGLQPRQVAIWFQNRRARWKTKQLEKDYNVLKSQFDSIKAHNDALKNHNNKLHAQLMALKGQESNIMRSTMVNLNKETEGSWTSSPMIGGLTPPYQTAVAGDEGFCNMLNAIEDQPAAFWPWPETDEQQDQHHLP